MTHGVADALYRMGFVVEEFGDQCAHRVIAYDQPDGAASSPAAAAIRPRTRVPRRGRAGRSPTQECQRGAWPDQVRGGLGRRGAAAARRAVCANSSRTTVCGSPPPTRSACVLEIGVGIANDQCPAAERGGAVIEAEVEEIDTVEVWWHTHGALVDREVAIQSGRLRMRLGLGVQAAVSRALWMCCPPITARCRRSATSRTGRRRSASGCRKRPPQPGRPHGRSGARPRRLRRPGPRSPAAPRQRQWSRR